MPTIGIHEDYSLGFAKQWLRDRIDKGEECPCCTQFAKVYRRKISSGMARGLIEFYRQHGMHWGYLPDVDASVRANGMMPLLRYWGLIQEETSHRKDGGRAGIWRVTVTGQAYVLGQIAIPKYTRIYDGKSLGLDVDEEETIADAVGRNFNYRDLMAGV